MSNLDDQFNAGQEISRRLVLASLQSIGIDGSSEEMCGLVLSAVETGGFQLIVNAILETARSPRFSGVMPMLLGVTLDDPRERTGGLLPTWAVARAGTLLWECRMSADFRSSWNVPEHDVNRCMLGIAEWLHVDNLQHDIGGGGILGEIADA